MEHTVKSRLPNVNISPQINIEKGTTVVNEDCFKHIRKKIIYLMLWSIVLPVYWWTLHVSLINHLEDPGLILSIACIILAIIRRL